MIIDVTFISSVGTSFLSDCMVSLRIRSSKRKTKDKLVLTKRTPFTLYYLGSLYLVLTEISSATLQDNRKLANRVAELEETLFRQTHVTHPGFGGTSSEGHSIELETLRRQISFLQGPNVSVTDGIITEKNDTNLFDIII